jgi:hypothetical protein
LSTAEPATIDGFFRFQRKRCNEFVAAAAAKCGIGVCAVRLDIEETNPATVN